MSFGLYGRRMIKSDETEVTVENVVAILNKALPYHWENRSEIQYLWYYYRGLQPILNREKQVRPEICNKIVENRANEIVSFKSGYLMGEPLQYVSRGNGDNLSDAINQLNEFVFAEEKPAKDKELADWFHICGTSFRMVLPDEDVGEDDDSPFEIYTLDPRNTFVVYNNGLGNKPLLGVKYVVDDNGIVHYSCYSDHVLGDSYKEGMTEEEISTALQAAGAGQNNDAEINRLKAQLSKANSEAADYKKQLRGKQTADEAAAAEQKATMDKLTQENTDLKRSIALADKKTKLVAMGYDEKLADSTAIAMVDGDMDTVMKNQATFNESREKAIRAEQMKKTPRPAAGSDGMGGMDYAKKIEEAQASGDLTAVAYYTRLKAQDEANQMKE